MSNVPPGPPRSGPPRSGPPRSGPPRSGPPGPPRSGPPGPPGPGEPRRLPPHIYRRRRLVFFLGFVALLVALILLIVRPGSGTPEPTPSPTPKPTYTAVPPASTATPSASASPTIDLSKYKPCDEKSLEVKPIVDAVDYQPDVYPQLQLSISNHGSTECYFNVGTSQQKFTITSGAETYWLSTDCQTGATDDVAILKPGKVYTSAAIEWNRERSAPETCGEARDKVPADGASYFLTTAVGPVKSATSTQFLLY